MLHDSSIELAGELAVKRKKSQGPSPPVDILLQLINIDWGIMVLYINDVFNVHLYKTVWCYIIQDLIYFFNFREKEISNSGSPKRWEIEVQYNCITCTINNLYIVWSIYKTFVECTCSQSLIKGIILLECLNVAITCTVCIMDMFTPTHIINILVRAGTKVGKQPLELHQQIWTNVWSMFLSILLLPWLAIKASKTGLLLYNEY